MEPSDWPIRQIKLAYHVGAMNPADKRRGSHEGAGLSICQHPEAWRRIARGLVAGDDWIVRCNPAGRFLDIHKLKAAHHATINAWGVEKGLIEKAQLFELSYYDDEFEQDYTCLFISESDALAEAEEQDGEVNPIDGFTATEVLKAISLNDCEPVMVQDMVTIAYAEQALQLSGCWWTDNLDPERLSAPRGVIFQSQLHLWAIERRT
jgi:hypothetical protein